MENINKRRRIILNTRQKIQNVTHKETRIIEHENQINKNIKFSSVNPLETNLTMNFTSIQPSNNLIADLSPVIWVDSSDLTSLLRDNKNNVYQILDKSGNNNHLYQSNVTNQPKYHNGNLLFNGNQYLTTNNSTFTQTINNMSIFIVLKQYNQSSNQGIISGLTTTSTSDITDANTWALYGSDGSTYQYEFNTNSNVLLNSNNINTTLPFGIYEIIIDNNSAKLYYDGTLINSSTFSELGTFTKLLLGSRYTNSTFNSFFQGEVSEILVLNSALSTDNRYKVEKYLLNKWQTTQISRTIPLSNVYTWLDASSRNNFIFDNSNNLITWKDMNSRMNFTQTNTTYSPLFENNKVLFNNSSLTCIDNIGLDLNNFSIFLVFEQVTHTNNARIISCINTIGETDTSVANGFTVLTNLTSKVSLAINSETLTYTDTTALLSKKLYEFVVTNGIGVVYINGVQQATNTFEDLGIGLRFTLGAKQNTTSNPFNGYIYELIVLNTSASYSEQNQIYGYLSEKWNLPIISSVPAPYQYMWLDSNNSSSITVDESNNITAWNDLSPNSFSVSISGTNPILQTLNGLQSAYFTDSALLISGGFSGTNATLFLVFSANSSMSTANSYLITFANGYYSFNINSNENNGSLKYSDGTITKYQTLIFNNNLNILSIRYINNVINLYINNYLVNSFSTPNWNFGSIVFSNDNYWIGNIPEFLFYNNSLDLDSYTGTMNYLSNKWQININSNLVNEYIPRAVTSTTKSISLTTKSSTTNDTLINPFTIMMTYNNSDETKAYYSYDGINYTLISSLNTIFSSGTIGGGIAWNGSIWLACTTGSPAFASSSDGITWTNVSTSPSFTSSTNNFLTWGNDKWILGANNGISYSYDTLNWTTNNILTNCLFAKYNPKTFLWVAGGTGATYKLVYSTNGINWSGSTSGTSLITNIVKAIGCNDSLWVASGLLTDNTSIMIYSFDGINWIQSISGTNVVTNCSSIVWNGKMWVAGGGVIGYSYDGINWLPTSASGTNLTWNGLYWTTGTKYSTNGINWTNISEGTTNTITNISAKINQPYRKNVIFLALANFFTKSDCLYSYDGILWYPLRGFTPNGFVLYYNNNLWIGCGFGSLYSMYYSLDATNWTGNNSLLQCFTVEYYNNLWIAGGYDEISEKTMVSSTNGIKWTIINSNPFTDNCYVIKNNGSLWVAGGGDGNTTLAYSSNGTTWNASTSGSDILDTYCKTLAWNGSIWLAGGQGNTYNLCSSSNGTSWTGITTDFTEILTIKWNNQIFVAGGIGPNTLQYSTDGTTWTASASATSIMSSGCYSLAWNGTIWVASGWSSSFAYSYDGINWTASISTGSGYYTLGVGYIPPTISLVTKYSNTNLTIISTYNTNLSSNRYYSYDGISWSPLTSLNTIQTGTQYGGPIGWNGSIWLAGARKENDDNLNALASSSDGINWTAINLTSSSIYINNIVWGVDKWILSDNGGSFGHSYSSDGINWTPYDNSIIEQMTMKALIWTGSIWFAGGNISFSFSLLYSYDGINWTGSQSATDLITSTVRDIAYSDSLVVAVGQGTNTVIYSYNNINWNISASGGALFFSYCQAIAYNGSIWVASGSANGNYLLGYSYDGINWLNSTSGTTIVNNNSECFSLNWNGSVFVAGCRYLGMLYSLDGINWTISPTSFTDFSQADKITSQNLFFYKKNTNYISIADTTNKSSLFNLNVPVPITQTLTNQLSITSTNPVYLSIIDKNVIYNLSEFVSGSSIVLPTLPYDSDYFAFINNGNYDITITGPNSLNVILLGNVNQIRYFTNVGGTYSQNNSFQGFTCTLNQYTNVIETFTVYLGGWSQSLNYIKKLYIFDGTTLVATTSDIYYGLTYQADFTLQLPTGTYTLIVSDTLISTGNIISSTIATPVDYTLSLSSLFSLPSASLDHYINGISLYVVTFDNFFPTGTTVDIWSSTNSDYSNGSKVATSETISNNEASFTYSFPPGYNYITIVDSTDSININIINPIVIYSFIFSLSSITHTSSKDIILDGWTDIFTTNLSSLNINIFTTSNFSDTLITLTFPTSTIVNTNGVYTLPFTYFWDIGLYYYFEITDPSNFLNITVSNYISPLAITGTIDPSVGLTNTNNVYTITLSNSESYDLSLFLTNWDIYYANNNLSNTGILITSAPINSNQEITFSYNPGPDNVVLYFYVGSTNVFTPPIRWLPTSINNCALWLDASLPSNFTFSSGLNISTWLDRSGNNVNISASNTNIKLTTNQVLFNGSNNYFTTSYPANNPNETVFMVVTFNSLSGEQDLVSSSSPGDRKYYLNSDGNISYERTDESFVLTNGGSPEVNTTYIYGFSNNRTNMIFYTNGSVTHQNTGTYTLSGSGSTLIGGSTGYFNGYISEIIVYTSILTTNQRQLVEGYLALKWGLEADLPNDHPFYNNTGTISPPTAPYSLTSSAISSSGFTITWSGGINATSYIYNLNGSPVTPSTDNGVSASNAEFSELTLGTQYVVNVIGVNPFGTVNSIANLTVSTTFSINYPLDSANITFVENDETTDTNNFTLIDNVTDSESAPTGLTTSNITLTGFNLSWTGGTGATSYLYKFNGVNITPRVDNGVTNRNATFVGITPGTYTLNVVAVNNGGSINSNPTISITLGPITSFTLLINQSITFSAFSFSMNQYNSNNFLLKNSNNYKITPINSNSSSSITFIIPISDSTSEILNYNDLNISNSNNIIQLSYNNINSTPIPINNTIQNIISYINGNDENLYSYLNGHLIAIDPINIIITTPNLNTNTIIFNNYALSNTERQLLEGNLAWESNINTQLPPTHPYYNVPPKSQITPETYEIQLNNWNSNITVGTLYLYDTQTNTFLTNITSIYSDETNQYFASFSYQFSKAQNYLTIYMTNMIKYDIPTPLVVKPTLTISAISNDPNNNWGYFNTSLIYSFILQSIYIDIPVNYLNYYSTINVYYADNTNFTNLKPLNNLIINNNGNVQVSFTINNPNISNVYFYFSYIDLTIMNLDNSWISDQYYFIDRSSLNFTLNNYTYSNPYILTSNLSFTLNPLYVFYSKDDPTYSSQQYLCSVSNNEFTANFTETGNYYLTITNVKDSETRTINDINVNITLPITVTSLTPTNITYTLDKPFETRINNSLIKLNSSSGQKQMYLFYSINTTVIKPLINPITNDNLYLVNNGNINLIPNITQDDNTITYFYGSSDKNYTTNIETYIPFIYINTNNFVLTVNNQTKILNIANYNSKLNQPLYLLAKNTKNNTYINLEQSLLLDANFNAKYNYDLPANMIYTLIITDSFNNKNNPNGNIIIESHPIYTFSLQVKLNRNTIYTGSNTITMNINNSQITSGNLFIDEVAHPNNPFSIKNNQFSFDITSNKNINLTFKTLDNILSVTQTITYKPIEAILVENNTIKLNNWNPLISSVDLYDNTEFINTFSIVYNKEYYIILNIVIYDNLQIKYNNILIPVSDFKPISTTNISVSPSTCSLNKPTTFYLSGVTHEYIYTSNTKYHSGKIGSGTNDLLLLNINNNQFTMTPNKLPLYIVTSPVKLTPSYLDTNTTFGLSNHIMEDTILNTKITNINSSFDQLNTFTINLDIRYTNIQIINKYNNLIINHTIKDNTIIFLYDSGYEEKSIFNIINQVSNEIYEIIYVNYI
jgi:hypothetical protein